MEPKLSVAMLEREGLGKYFRQTKDGTRLECLLNGHSLPVANVQALECFIKCVYSSGCAPIMRVYEAIRYPRAP